MNGHIILYPYTATAAAFYTVYVWASPVSLAATKGISLDFFSSGYLDVSLLPLDLCELLLSSAYTDASHRWVLPLGNPRFYVYLATTRGLSQLVTSFINSRYLGIHRKLFTT